MLTGKLNLCRSYFVCSIMSGRAILSDVGTSHTLEIKTTDVIVTRQAHFESSKATTPLVCYPRISVLFISYVDLSCLLQCFVLLLCVWFTIVFGIRQFANYYLHLFFFVFRPQPS